MMTGNRILLRRLGAILARGIVLGGGLVPFLAWSLFPGAPAAAQSLANSFAGFSAAKDAPVDIEADRLEVFDAKKKAYFRGNVKVTQGKLVMRSKELEVTYTAKGSNKKVAPGSPNAAVKFIRATGRVVIDTPDNQSVTSQWALFDVQRQFITIGGGVVMSQGSNVMKGEKLLIDLKAGTSRLETGRARGGRSDGRGRVRVILNPRDTGALGKIGERPSARAGGRPSASGARDGDRSKDKTGRRPASGGQAAAGADVRAAPGASGQAGALPWRRRKEAADRFEAFGEGLTP